METPVASDLRAQALFWGGPLERELEPKDCVSCGPGDGGADPGGPGDAL
jgi:hypothetical protein